MISKGRNLMHIVRLTALGAVMFLCLSCANIPDENDGIMGLVSSKLYRNDQKKTGDAAEKNKPSDGKASSRRFRQKALSEQEGNKLLPWSNHQVTDYMYRISAGDELSVSFFRKPHGGQPEEYLIGVMDVLYVDVRGQADLSQSVTVRPDGKISYPMIGELHARGRTIADMQAEFEKHLTAKTPSLEVTLALEKGHVLAEEFIERTSRQDTGPYTVVTVRPDGIINLPLIGEMMVTGMTIPDITGAISERYDKVLNGGIALNLNLVTTRANTAILGEVKKPGMYPLYEPRHPIYGIAMAGGELETANLSRIILLKRTPDKGFRQYKLDLKAKHVSRLQGMSPAFLGPGDILLVPKTGIANANKWVEQYIRKLLPVSTSAGATYNINDRGE